MEVHNEVAGTPAGKPMGEPIGGTEAAQKELAELLEKPLSKEEAAKIFAEQDIRRAQLGIIRQKWTAQATQLQLQIASLDQELLAIELDRSVAFRRTLNAPADKPASEGTAE